MQQAEQRLATYCQICPTLPDIEIKLQFTITGKALSHQVMNGGDLCHDRGALGERQNLSYKEMRSNRGKVCYAKTSDRFEHDDHACVCIRHMSSR
jgi:hypothetical protein